MEVPEKIVPVATQPLSESEAAQLLGLFLTNSSMGGSFPSTMTHQLVELHQSLCGESRTAEFKLDPGRVAAMDET